MNKIKRRNIKRATSLKVLFFTFLGAFIFFFVVFTCFLPIVTPKVEIPVLAEDHVINSITSQDFRSRIDPSLHAIELREELSPKNLNPFNKNNKETAQIKTPLSVREPADSISSEDKWLYDLNKKKLDEKEEVNEINEKPKDKNTIKQASLDENQEIVFNIPPRPRPFMLRDKVNITPPVPIFQAKVIIGDFSNPKEAKIASDILLSLNFNPFIRERNGKYILQVDSFSNTKKAKALVKELKNRNFDAKIIYE